ncbi:MAG: hypothetical protein DLM72_11285 [Candidatus Nitrosopolaris wilkensis]|nr:MAG: hypothetical protein DLM72_11285 [Candidatus Nitrosopolaris wilkensis]
MNKHERASTQDKEKIRKVELMVQLKMIEMGVTKRDAYVWWYGMVVWYGGMVWWYGMVVWYGNDLTQKPPPNNKIGWYVTKSDSELTVEEKESI